MRLYLHVGKAQHFLRWERAEFARHFDLVDAPSPDAALLSFGPDVFEEAATLPARGRFAVLFPGFSFNPVRDMALRDRQRSLITHAFDQVFINPGPLEIAYAGLDNVSFYPFSVDTSLVGFRRHRTGLDSLLHVSHDNPQKDWHRSASVMTKTGLPFEVFPPRDPVVLTRHVRALERRNAVRRLVGRRSRGVLPIGYFDHARTIREYHRFDGFVHVARDVRHPEFIDGKYTAALIEAGVSGAILFWHDTWGLGNGLETVFELPLDTAAAAQRILEVREGVDIEAHSRRTREEMLDTFSPTTSVGARVRVIQAIAG